MDLLTIEAQELTITYGRTKAVRDVTLKIPRGEKLSIVGKSGSGKTSLLHAFAGLIPISGGRLLMDGQKVDGISEKTAIILQKDGLFPWKNVKDNILLGAASKMESDEWTQARMVLIMKQLGIGHLGQRFLKELSGGERQRVAIARAMIQAPDLLLMDEPSSALDMVTKEAFQASVHHMFDEQITTVTVTHDIEEAVYLGERILIMDKGEIIEKVTNPYFREKDVRNTLDFYKLCLEVRQVMSR